MKRNYPHCVITWDLSGDQEIRGLRLLTAEEFLVDGYKGRFWHAYRPDGITEGPFDESSTSTINRYGLEAFILQLLLNHPGNVSADQLRNLRKDLQRLAIDDWDKTE